MKKLLLVAMLAALPFSITSVWAVDAHHSDANSKSAVAMTDKEKQIHMAKMQENMLNMHEQMHKITEAKTPQDREQHMQKHVAMMKDSKSMMRSMMTCDGKDGMMDSEMKMDGGMKKGY